MGNRIEKIKQHVKDHEVAYACGATAVITAGITFLIMKGCGAAAIVGADGPETADTLVTVHPRNFLNFWNSNSFNQTIVSVVEREGRGHTGYIVRCKETLEEFPSQKAAALMAKVSDMIMSLHIRGEIPDINGYHYERVPA